MQTSNIPYQVHPDVFTTEIDNQVVLLQYETGTYFTLNEVGTKVWQALEQGKTMPEILHYLLQEYAVSEKQLQQDILNLVDKLKEKGLIL